MRPIISLLFNSDLFSCQPLPSPGKSRCCHYLQVFISLEADEWESFNNIFLVKRLFQGLSNFLPGRPRRLHLYHVLVFVVVWKKVKSLRWCRDFWFFDRTPNDKIPADTMIQHAIGWQISNTNFTKLSAPSTYNLSFFPKKIKCFCYFIINES